MDVYSSRILKSHVVMVNYKLVGFLKEGHSQPLFGVQFNPFLPEKRIFATVGTNRVTVYQCVPDNQIVPIQCYTDADAEENFYTCTWSLNDSGEVLLAVGGVKGVIRILSTDTMQCIITFTGHGNAVNELQIHPKDNNLLLSASKDYALRLWNIKTAICVAIFGGVDGHRDEVLSADFNFEGTCILSAGMDHALKMWDLQTDEYTDVIRQSYEHVKGSKESFPILEVHFPKYSTREIHRNYIDCVRWFGRLAFSKSCENSLILWRPPRPDDKPQQKSFQVLQKFEVPNCEIWYIRFAMDRKMKYLALGNQVGKIYIWDTTQNDVIKGRPSVILSSAKCFTAVRQVTFSNDSKTIIGVCDNGTVWRWDAKS